MRTTLCLLLFLSTAPAARAEVLVRWDQDQVPSHDNLGVSALVVPAANAAAVQKAIAQGFEVYLEGDAASLTSGAVPGDRIAGVVLKGDATPEQIAAIRKQLGRSTARVLKIETRALWPHIRSNVVTTRNNVMQVGSRTAQPWLEHNGALVRLAQLRTSDTTPVLSYEWRANTAVEAEEGPALENYLVAIAEAGSFGGDLVLPLHPRLQKGLLLGKPLAREWWSEIRNYIEFFSWSAPARYNRIANVGVVTADPARSIEVTKLLTRHNVPFDVLAPDRVQAASLAPYRLLVVPEAPAAAQVAALTEFAKQGGIVFVTAGETPFPWRSGEPLVKTDERVAYKVGEGRVIEVLKRILDPNRFALEVRDALGRDKRLPVEIWNGITVLAAPYKEPDTGTVLLTVVNYAHEADSVEFRIPGTFSVVQYESPEEDAGLLPYTHRNGYTEFVLPALRVGGRVFLSEKAGLE